MLYRRTTSLDEQPISSGEQAPRLTHSYSANDLAQSADDQVSNRDGLHSPQCCLTVLCTKHLQMPNSGCPKTVRAYCYAHLQAPTNRHGSSPDLMSKAGPQDDGPSSIEVPFRFPLLTGYAAPDPVNVRLPKGSNQSRIRGM